MRNYDDSLAWMPWLMGTVFVGIFAGLALLAVGIATLAVCLAIGPACQAWAQALGNRWWFHLPEDVQDLWALRGLVGWCAGSALLNIVLRLHERYEVYQRRLEAVRQQRNAEADKFIERLRSLEE